MSLFIAAVPQTKPSGGLIARLRSGLKRANTLCRCEEEGIGYYRLAIKIKRGEPDFTEVRALFPRFTGKLLVAKNLDLPQELAALKYSSAGFRARLMLRASAKISELLPLPLIKRSIGLVDEEGIYPSFTETLIKYSPVVMVYTLRPERYSCIRELLMERYGAPLILAQSLFMLNSCALVYLPECGAAKGLTAPLLISGGTPTGLGRENLLYLHSLALGREALNLVPEGIAPVDFFGAASELCARREYESLAPAAYLAGSRVITAGELAQYIPAVINYR